MVYVIRARTAFFIAGLVLIMAGLTAVSLAPSLRGGTNTIVLPFLTKTVTTASELRVLTSIINIDAKTNTYDFVTVRIMNIGLTPVVGQAFAVVYDVNLAIIAKGVLTTGTVKAGQATTLNLDMIWKSGKTVKDAARVVTGVVPPSENIPVEASS